MRTGVKGEVELQRKLNTFDVTSLVVGSIIGADIYVATAIGARLVGPASLLVWALAGAMALVIALSFSYCVMLLPKVGGPYAYVKEVSGPFSGFMVGWGLLLAEWFSLAVFPVAFVQYFSALFPGLDSLEVVLLKAFFIVFIILTNIAGVKVAGRLNDGLTIAKLLPLLLIIVAGVAFIFLSTAKVVSNLTPFFIGGAGNFGQALVLIFWAYAGFELSTLPAGEVERPERTIPKAIAIGMTLVIAFYLLTNLIVLGSVDQHTFATTTSPLLDTVNAIFIPGTLLAVVMVAVVGVGALLSIMGADESGTIGTSRLSFAMAVDGLLPSWFSRLHKKYGTPYLGLIILCSTAFIASLVGGLTALINASVFLLAFVYFATCFSTLFLEKEQPHIASRFRLKRGIPILGMIFSLMLMAFVDPLEILVSILLLGVGVPIYIWFSPKKEIKELREAFLSREAVLRRAYVQSIRFLAWPIHKVKALYYRRKRKPKAFVVKKEQV